MTSTYGAFAEHYDRWAPAESDDVDFYVERARAPGGPIVELGVGTGRVAAEAIPHGPDPEPMLEEIRGYAEAGFTHAYVHQIGPDQQGFLDFARRELLPQV